MDKLFEVLVNNGPVGIVSAIFLTLWVWEKRNHAEERKELVQTLIQVTEKYEATLGETTKVLATLDTFLRERLARVGG